MTEDSQLIFMIFTMFNLTWYKHACSCKS